MRIQDLKRMLLHSLDALDARIILRMATGMSDIEEVERPVRREDLLQHGRREMSGTLPHGTQAGLRPGHRHALQASAHIGAHLDDTRRMEMVHQAEEELVHPRMAGAGKAVDGTIGIVGTAFPEDIGLQRIYIR